MQKTFTETTYVICYNGFDVIHPSRVEAGTVLASGQPLYEEFASEEEWKARLTELGYVDRSVSLQETLTPEERKALTPEERKALRLQKRASA